MEKLINSEFQSKNMADDFAENELAGSKWQILQALSTSSLSPKQMADKLGTTIANVSQQLRLLEAKGYLKKERTDKGKGARKEKDVRVSYSLVKNRIFLTSIHPLSVERKEIRTNQDNSFYTNVLIQEFKLETNYLFKFYLDHEALFKYIDALFYLKMEGDEINLIVLTEDVSHFRGQKSILDVVVAGKKASIKFWSHTVQEIKEGFGRNEKYFLDLMAKPVLLYEKSPNYAKKQLEGIL